MGIESFIHLLPLALKDSLPAHLDFRTYMDVCMFDPKVGYYGSGKVQIGMFQDYWTYPVRMSPVFGELLAHRIVEVWRVAAPSADRFEGPFQVVEVGGGRGELLRDVAAVLTRWSEHDEQVADLLSQIELVAVDRSSSLLADQQLAHGDLVVSHINANADELATVLPTPFWGVVFANELLTQLSVEVLRCSEKSVERLCVLPWCDPSLGAFTMDETIADKRLPQAVQPGWRPLRPEVLPDLIGALESDDGLLKAFAAGESVAWTGFLEPVDESKDFAVAQYLSSSKSAIERLSAQGALPSWVCFAPGVTGILDELAILLRDGVGAFITVDYGGSAFHVFDNQSRYPHLRTFSRALDANLDDPNEDEYEDKVHNPFRAPGCEDLTYDLDFTWVASYLENLGLDLAFYGNQGALEAPLDLWKQPYQKQLVHGRQDEGFEPMEALVRAHALLKRFRDGSGFRLFAVSSPGLSDVFSKLGPSDPLRYDELPSVPRDMDADQFHALLMETLGEVSATETDASKKANRCIEVLHPSGSVIEDLDDGGLYRWRVEIIEALGRVG